MPRILSASVDDTRCSTDISPFRLSHAVSAYELGASKQASYATLRVLKRGAFGRVLRTVSSSPLTLISLNVPISASTSEPNSAQESELSAPTSEREELRVPFHHLELSTPANAYPSPPSSVCGEPSDSPRGTDLDEDPVGIPFPLNPAPMLASIHTSVDRDEGPRTPRRRCVSDETSYLTPSPSPDRYIPERDSAQNTSKTFRLSKSPDQLSTAERLLRHKSATPDPFGPLHLPRLRNGGPNIPTIEDPQAIRSPSRTIGLTNVLALPQDPLTVQNRQASAGAIWNVGGHGQATHLGPVRAVSNGRGGFISSGSNAPMYGSQFLDGDVLDQDESQMESRLATALEIDQTSRVLRFFRSPEQIRSASTGSVGTKRKCPYVEPRTHWMRGEWVKESSPSCESPSRLMTETLQLSESYYGSLHLCCGKLYLQLNIIG